VALWELGEYAVLLQRAGEAEAARAFPPIAAHLGAGCDPCAAALPDLVAQAERHDRLARALARHDESRRVLDILENQPDRPPDLNRYYQRRWDSDTLADVAELDEELRRRLAEEGAP
jgi:hypothetical protein